MLRKARVTEKIHDREYLVEDIFDGMLIQMRVSAKQDMHHQFEIGEEVYVLCLPSESSIGRLITASNMKMDDTNGLFTAKARLDLRQKLLE